MDKYEYRVRADEIRAHIQNKNYKAAVEIADTIDWKCVKSSMMLCSISDLYKMCKRFEDSRDVLLLAYERNPQGRMILYSLCELSIKLGKVVDAIEFYKEYKLVAPKDPGIYVLKYKLYTAQGVGLEERIGVLEELQECECKEKWMYELAYLYHMQGVSEKCVEECNQIVLYFGEGRYVIKALELKALHEPLSALQDELYRRLTSPKENEILVRDMDVSKFNTIDLQKELASGVAEVLFDDTKQLPNVSEQAGEAEKQEVIVEEEVIIEEPEQSNEEAPEALHEEIVEEESVTKEPHYVEDKTVEIPSAHYASDDTAGDAATEKTQVINTKAVEEAIRSSETAEPVTKEPGMARTVMPHRNLDEMREVMPKSSKNPAIVFPNYDDMVSMEGDGQISFNLPDQQMVDKQITGQISIEEVLAEWERMKRANEKKWRDDMKRKVLAQTTGILKDFEEKSRDGLLEKLEEEVSESERVELTETEKENLIKDEEEASSTSGEAEFIPEVETVSDVPIAIVPTPDVAIGVGVGALAAAISVDETEKEETPVEKKEDKESESGDIREIFFEDDTEDESEEETAETSVETQAEETEAVVEESEAQAEEQPEEQREPDEEESKEPSAEELYFDRTPYVETEPEEIATESEPDAGDITEVLPTVGDLDYYMAFAAASEERDMADKAMMEAASTESEEVSATEIVEEIPDTVIATDEFEEEVESTPEIEEEEEIEESVEEEPVSEIKEDVSVDVVEPQIRESGFTETQEARFEAFIQTEAAREQLKEVLAEISMDADHGNVIIGSEDVDSSVELAKAIMMELSDRVNITGKIAKIKASTLNAKDVEETLQKMYDGALIIQDANELRPETLDAMKRVLAVPDSKMFIILTCIRRAKHRFIMENRDFLVSFNISVDIDALTNRELVQYAKGYAYSKECSIDELGMLALHRRIEERQTNEHAVSVIEVKAIVDSAIANASKKNVRHFMDVLVNKRYDENDMIVLKERDFEE